MTKKLTKKQKGIVEFVLAKEIRAAFEQLYGKDGIGGKLLDAAANRVTLSIMDKINRLWEII
jgi:hypothetical protein